MSELRSVIAFFLGLVFFVVIIGLAIGRIRLPKRTQPQTVTELVTPTPVPTAVPTKKPGLLDRIAGIFKKPTPTPTKKPTPTTKEIAQVQETGTPVTEMKQALEPEETTSQVVTNKGGQVISIDRFPEVNQTIQTKGGQTIPESGAPTLLIPFSLMLGGLGQYLKKKK